jgi:hypothetical protein
MKDMVDTILEESAVLSSIDESGKLITITIQNFFFFSFPMVLQAFGRWLGFSVS